MSVIPPKSNSTDFVRVDFFGSPATYDEMDYASLKPFLDKDALLCNNTGACDSKYKQVIIEAETHYKWLAGEMDDTPHDQIRDSAANIALIASQLHAPSCDRAKSSCRIQKPSGACGGLKAFLTERPFLLGAARRLLQNDIAQWRQSYSQVQQRR